MIRVLQCVNNMNRAGLETMLMNYYRNVDKTKVQFDFLTHRSGKADYDDEIESLGGKIYHAPRLYPQNYPAYFHFMKQFYMEHPEYRIVHSHIDAMSYLPLFTAKKAGVPIRIAHSHNTCIDKDIKYPLKQYFRHKLPEVANYYLACGTEAGKFLFADKYFEVVPNAIDVSNFSFSNTVREKKRMELGLTDKFVIGHVGRFSPQKNHKFLINVFKEISGRTTNAVLLLIGAGEKETEICELVEKLNLSSHVLFMGKRGDTNELYQVMDVFILPSLFEGLPLVGIEAQAAGLPCVFSDKVPAEVKVTDNCEFLSLGKSAEEWADTVLSIQVDNRAISGIDLLRSQYCIESVCERLEEFYLNL